MTTRAPTRDLLIEVGTNLIAEHGYNATGINAVLKEAGVPKGCFYHYFSSKEAFGLAVIEAAAVDDEVSVQALLGDVRTVPLERLKAFFAAKRADMVACKHRRGCLIGNLGQEMSAHSDVLRDALDAIWQRRERQLAACLQDGQHDGSIRRDIDVAALASFILAGWQGALLRSKIVRDCTPLVDFECTLLAFLKP
jgi:TetR/AcrR family transcriptional regulator, transcriptional repressor for nem operon